LVKHWLFLALAIVAEVVATTSLKASDGFQNLGPSLLVVVGYALAFTFMSQAIKVIPVGITYAVWSGFGIVLVSFTSWLLYGQKLDQPALVGIGLSRASGAATP
jgi:multidrug transporter EmrE-like cation transporter